MILHVFDLFCSQKIVQLFNVGLIGTGRMAILRAAFGPGKKFHFADVRKEGADVPHERKPQEFGCPPSCL